jgi:hypothetical protein
MTRRAVVRELTLIALFILITIVVTWPLARALTTATSDLGDPLLNAWILDWDLYSFAHGNLRHIFDAPIFFPSKYPLAYSENLFGIAFLMLPFYLFGCSPLAVYNIAVIAGYALCGYGASVLARRLTGSMTAGIVAGILYAFTAFRFDHLAHLQLIWGGWLPLIVASLLWYWEKPGNGRAAAFGALILINGLTNLHFLMFGTLSAAVTIAVLAAIDPRGIAPLVRILAAMCIACGLIVPIMLPYRTVAALYDMHRTWNDAIEGSARWEHWLLPALRSKTYGAVVDPDRAVTERSLFPGLMLIFLSIAGLFYTRTKSELAGDATRPPRPPWLLHLFDALIVIATIITYWGAVSKKYFFTAYGHRLVSVEGVDLPATALVILLFARFALQLPLAWTGGTPRTLGDATRRGTIPLGYWIGILWVTLGVIGSLGVNAFFYQFLYKRVPGFDGIRVPARWASIAYVGLAVTAAYGVAALQRMSRSAIARAAVSVILIYAAWWDIRPWIRWENAVPDVDAVYTWLKATPAAAPLLEIPVEQANAQFLYLLSATVHHRPALNGTSGWEPPEHRQLREMYLQEHLPAGFLPFIEKSGCHTIVVHDDWLREQGDRVHEWLRRDLAAGRLVFLRRFDHRTGGDFVFAVRANVPDPRPLIGPHTPDPTGAMPEQNLARMLDGGPTYLDRTFGVMDSPAFNEEVGHSLTVSGWALSPYTVRSAEVLLHCGVVRVPARLTSRADVLAKYPWYPASAAGFTAIIPRRPRGVPKYTDVQVEITDGSGRRTRLPDAFITW